jgi:major membrane immunogen (membrane-anchored lipoprotein)
MLNRKTLVVIILSTAVLTACGSSDNSSQLSGSKGPSYNGVTTQAAIDDGNAQSLAVAAADGSGNGDNQDQLNAVFNNVFTNLQNQKGGISAQAAVTGNCGGSATYPDNLSQQQSPISGTVSFSDYCIDGGTQVGQLVIDGQISFSADVQNSQLISMSIALTNLVITFNGNTITTNSSMTFAEGGMTFETSTDFSGSQGQTLRIENLVMSGSPDTGISIASGRLYQPDFGYVDISTSQNLVYQGCDIGRPNSGIMLLSGSGGSTAQVTFSCASYEVCVNGTTTCNMYNW